MTGGTLRWNDIDTFGTRTTKMADGKTASQKLLFVTFDELLTPFGANVSYKPVSSKDEARLHQFG